jgi:methyl-accepting chemotaxis protein
MKSPLRVPAGLRTRLHLSFASVQLAMLVAAVAAGLGLWQLQGEQLRRAAQSAQQAAVAAWSAQVQTNLDRAVLATRLEAAGGDAGSAAEGVAPVMSKLAEAMAETARASEQLQQAMMAGAAADAEQLGLIEAVVRDRTAFVALRAAIRDDLQMGEGAARIDAELVPAAGRMLASLNTLAAHADTQAARADAAVAERARAALVWLVGGSLLGLALGAWLARGTARAVVQPLAEAIATARRIAEGDLRPAPAVSRADELGQLQQALAEMQTSLSGLVAGVRSTSESLRAASSEVASGNHDLSRRTEQAAASLQQTSASMEQLGTRVTSSAGQALQASELTRAARDGATRGGEVVAQVVQTMAGIQDASRRIADITSVIDGIAFQTNILALNAAVEAARAGEQGRGFAVVAAEVRALAQKSAAAAREIKSLIGDSVERVEAGHALVHQAGGTIGNVVVQVRRVDELVAELSRAAHEQQQGIAEVGQAVSQLDQATQQNAALVEESAAAADSLRQQADRLQAATAVFRLNTANIVRGSTS